MKIQKEAEGWLGCIITFWVIASIFKAAFFVYSLF